MTRLGSSDLTSCCRRGGLLNWRFPGVEGRVICPESVGAKGRGWTHMARFACPMITREQVGDAGESHWENLLENRATANCRRRATAAQALLFTAHL